MGLVSAPSLDGWAVAERTVFRPQNGWAQPKKIAVSIVGAADALRAADFTLRVL